MLRLSSPVSEGGILSSLERSWDSMSCMETIVVGDFNADTFDLSNIAWHHLLNVTSCHNLRNYICEPTRITPSSKTCLELLFSTSDLTPVSTHVVETHCCDHCMIVGEFDVCLPAPPTRVSLYSSKHQFDTQTPALSS